MHTILRIIVALTLVFAPWAFGTTEPWSLHILEVLCFLSAVLLVIQRVISRDPALWKLRRPVILVLGLFPLLFIGLQLLNPVHLETVVPGSVFELVGGNLSWPHTIQWASTWEVGLRWMCLLLFGWVVLQTIRTRDDITFLLRLLVLNAVLVSLEGILQRLAGTDLLLGFRVPRHGGEMFGPFVCRNNFVSFANLCLPIALGMALLPDILPRRETPSTPERFFWGFCASILFSAVVLSASRMGVAISLLVACAVILDFALRRRDSSNKRGQGRLVLALVFGCGLVFLVGGTLQVFSRFERTVWMEPGRTDVWKALWMAITESPFWGYGLGTSRYLLPFYQSVENPFFYEYAHNDWLEAVFDLGGIGFALIVLFVMAVMVAIARERIFRTSSFRRSAASCCLIPIVGCLVHALVDFPLHIAAVQITFVAIAATGLSLQFVRESNSG